LERVLEVSCTTYIGHLPLKFFASILSICTLCLLDVQLTWLHESAGAWSFQ